MALQMLYMDHALLVLRKRVLYFWHTLGNKDTNIFVKYFYKFKFDRYGSLLQSFSGQM